MSIKYSNLKELLHPGSLHDIKRWLSDEKASLSDKDLDELALQSLIKSEGPNRIPDREKALKLFNIKLKQHIANSKE